MKTQEQKIQWIKEQHESIQQWYDEPQGLVYTFHLEMVSDFGNKYRHLVPTWAWDFVELALWGHDLLEDVEHLTYETVCNKLSVPTAFIIKALSRDKNKPKSIYYRQLADYGTNNNFAIFVKLADRLANVTYSLRSGSTMWKKYKKENQEFLDGINRYGSIQPYQEMVDELNQLFIQEWTKK